MAQPGSTIDPNDLDSIDALLDEVEERAVQDSELLPADEPVQNVTPEPQQQGPQDQDDELERMLDSTMEASVSESSMPNLSKDEPRQVARNFEAEREAAEFDEILSRRAKKSANEYIVTVEEMNSLRMMVIGFGSALIVLALIAIGIATWGALGANSDDGEDIGILEQIRGETEISRVSVKENEAILRELGRKLDALSFQIEQVNNDLTAMTVAQPSANSINGIAAVTPVVEATPVAVVAESSKAAAPVVPLESSKLEAKVDAVSQSLAVAQRRVVEINNRVKSMQEQYNSVIQAVKLVEKNILEQQLEQHVEPAAEEEAKVDAKQTDKPSESNIPDAYRYKAPDGMFYDAGNRNSFP